MESNKKYFAQRQREKQYERIVVGDNEFNAQRRENLLANASMGFGKVKQVGRHLSYTVGNDAEGYIEYFILNASITK